MTDRPEFLEDVDIDLRQVARQVQRVADELAIRNLVANIYLMADHEPDLDAYGENFTEDAVWERVDDRGAGPHLSTRLVGRDEILADRRELRRKDFTGPTSRRRHLLTTLAVDVGDGGTATARSKYLVVHGLEPRPVIASVGQYEDTFRRTETGWKLCHRRYATLGVAPDVTHGTT